MAETLAHRFTEFLLGIQRAEVRRLHALKSGRKSPYFINAGAFDDGQKIAALGAFYRRKISQPSCTTRFPATSTPCSAPPTKGHSAGRVHRDRADRRPQIRTVGYTFDRKGEEGPRRRRLDGWHPADRRHEGAARGRRDDRRHRRARSHPQTQGRGERRGRGSRALRGPHGEDPRTPTCPP